MYQDYYVFRINYFNRTITILQKCNYFYICNLLTKKFENFTGLETFTIYNEERTFEKRIMVNPKYIDKYLSSTIEYLSQLQPV